MDYKFTLRRFFVLVFLFVICPIVGWIVYAHRYNAPANAFLNDETGASVMNNITIPDEKLDVTTPFYQNDTAERMEKAQGRPTANDAEPGYFYGEIKGGEHAEHVSKAENATETKTEMPADSAKKETK